MKSARFDRAAGREFDTGRSGWHQRRVADAAGIHPADRRRAKAAPVLPYCARGQQFPTRHPARLRRVIATAPVFAIRAARADDLPALVALENSVFDYDRMSARQYRRHLAGAGATLLVAADAGGVLASALSFRRRGSRVSRLYSLATAPAARGRGVARALLAAIEADAVTRGAERMRLEVRTDNAAAIALYERSGYVRIGELPAYYDDGADARRYEKNLRR